MEKVMDKIEIIGVPKSTFVRTVRIAAEEMGIAYDLTPEPPHSPPVKAIHPLGKVPVMRHGDLELYESRAIITYFERALGGTKLTPSDPREASRVEQWASLLTTGLIPNLLGEYLVAYIFPGTPDNSPDRARVEKALPGLERDLAILEQEAASNGMIGGSDFSIADAYFIPVLHYLRAHPESGAIIRASAGLSAYAARTDERPSVKATVPGGLSGEVRQRAARILSGAEA